MRVLVTGATTTLGEALVHALAEDDSVEEVLALGLEPEEELSDTLQQAAVQWVRTDLSHHRNIREVVFGPAWDHHIDAVVHLALHRRASDTGRRIHKLNVHATRLLLRMAEEHPTIRRFVFRSTGHVYALKPGSPTVLREDNPLDLTGHGPQWLRDRIEADVAVCTRMGLTDLKTVVLRTSEIVAPGVGSQLYDYLQSRVCLRPVGFDPMLNLLSLDDAVAALRGALAVDATGVFNIPGADTLPLSEAVQRCDRPVIPIPGPALGPLYRLRRRVKGADFRYDLNAARFHYSGLLDGTRAERVLGYRPQHSLDWAAICPG